MKSFGSTNCFFFFIGIAWHSHFSATFATNWVRTLFCRWKWHRFMSRANSANSQLACCAGIWTEMKLLTFEGSRVQVKKGNLWQSLALLQVGESSAGFSCRRPDSRNKQQVIQSWRHKNVPGIFWKKNMNKKQHQDLFACIFDCIPAISLGRDMNWLWLAVPFFLPVFCFCFVHRLSLLPGWNQSIDNETMWSTKGGKELKRRKMEKGCCTHVSIPFFVWDHMLAVI